MTASIGVAEHRGNHSLDELVRCADLAMYAAKNGGRNRTVSYDRLLAAPPAGPAAADPRAARIGREAGVIYSVRNRNGLPFPPGGGA